MFSIDSIQKKMDTGSAGLKVDFSQGDTPSELNRIFIDIGGKECWKGRSTRALDMVSSLASGVLTV